MENINIKDILPHRYPFLFIDSIFSLEPGKSGVGIKNVSINEPYFQGHFPENPIVPGVLLIEMMAQMGAIVAKSGLKAGKEDIGYLVKIENVKFLNIARPGDVLNIKAEIKPLFGGFTEVISTITSKNDVIARGKLIVTTK